LSHFRPRITSCCRVGVDAVQGGSSSLGLSLPSTVSYIVVVSIGTELWTQIEAANSQATSEAHFVKEMERLNRCQDCQLNRSVPEFPLDE
jgi:hypothetical protein